MHRDAYTRIFLKAQDLSDSKENVAFYTHEWWWNTRSSDNPGLRLTDAGLEIVINSIKLHTFEVVFENTKELNPQALIYLDKFITCPYYIAPKMIIVTDDRKAVELQLFSNNINKFGLAKVLDFLS
jgi:hypothetical protein